MKKFKIQKSWKVKLIKPHHEQRDYLLKIYPKGSGNTGLIVAKRNFLPNWMRRLYYELAQCNADVPINEMKKNIGEFMRTIFSKKDKKKFEDIHKKHQPKRSKRIAVFT